MNAGVKYDNDDAGARFISGMLGAGITQGLGERLSVTAEVVAQQIARQRHGGGVVTADFAVAYLLSRNVQVDALVGRGLTSESPKYLLTTGISARF